MKNSSRSREFDQNKLGIVVRPMQHFEQTLNPTCTGWLDQFKLQLELHNLF